MMMLFYLDYPLRFKIKLHVQYMYSTAAQCTVHTELYTLYTGMYRYHYTGVQVQLDFAAQLAKSHNNISFQEEIFQIHIQYTFPPK